MGNKNGGDDPRHAFAKWLRGVRAEKAQSQAEVAKAVGVHQMTVSRWESGAAVPNGAQLPPIVKWSGAPAEKIVGLIGRG